MPVEHDAHGALLSGHRPEGPAGDGLMTRVFVCVLDGCGAGALPDAAAYGDEGSDTLRHVLERVDVPLPNLAGLGLGEIVGLPLGAPRREATYGRLAERGAGKDTTTGHWEMMGVVLERPFPTYPDGFPPEVIEPFEAAIGRQVLVQPAGLRHGHHRRARRRARGHRTAHRLHLRGLRLPDRLPRGRRPRPASCTRGARRRARSCGVRTPSAASSRGRSTARPATTRARRGGATSRWSRPGRRISTCSRSGASPWSASARSARSSCSAASTSTTTPRTTRPGSPPARATSGEMEDGLLFANLVDFDTVWGHRNDVAGFAGGLADSGRRAARVGGAAGRGRRHDPLRRPRRRSDHREHRPLARVLAAAGARARARALRRRAGGRRRHRLRAPDGGGAAAPRTADRLMAGRAGGGSGASGRLAPARRRGLRLGALGAPGRAGASWTKCPTTRSAGRPAPCPAT